MVNNGQMNLSTAAPPILSPTPTPTPSSSSVIPTPVASSDDSGAVALSAILVTVSMIIIIFYSVRRRAVKRVHHRSHVAASTPFLHAVVQVEVQIRSVRREIEVNLREAQTQLLEAVKSQYNNNNNSSFLAFPSVVHELERILELAKSNHNGVYGHYVNTAIDVAPLAQVLTSIVQSSPLTTTITTTIVDPGASFLCLRPDFVMRKVYREMGEALVNIVATSSSDGDGCSATTRTMLEGFLEVWSTTATTEMMIQPSAATTSTPRGLTRLVVFLQEITLYGPWAPECKAPHDLYNSPDMFELLSDEYYEGVVQGVCEVVLARWRADVVARVDDLCRNCVEACRARAIQGGHRINNKKDDDEDDGDRASIPALCQNKILPDVLMNFKRNVFDAVMTTTTDNSSSNTRGGYRTDTFSKCCGHCVSLPPSVRRGVKSRLDDVLDEIMAIAAPTIVMHLQGDTVKAITAGPIADTCARVVDLLLPDGTPSSPWYHNNCDESNNNNSNHNNNDNDNEENDARALLHERARAVYEEVEASAQRRVDGLEAAAAAVVHSVLQDDAVMSGLAAARTYFVPHAQVLLDIKKCLAYAEDLCSMSLAVGGAFTQGASARLREQLRLQRAVLEGLRYPAALRMLRLFEVPISHVAASYNYHAKRLDPPEEQILPKRPTTVTTRVDRQSPSKQIVAPVDGEDCAVVCEVGAEGGGSKVVAAKEAMVPIPEEEEEVGETTGNDNNNNTTNNDRHHTNDDDDVVVRSTDAAAAVRQLDFLAEGE
eukprot:PhM_4_TR2485/c0_g1_i2/m.33961